MSSWDVNFISWERLDSPQLFIKYEDLINDPLLILNKITSFFQNNIKIEIADLDSKIEKIHEFDFTLDGSNEEKIRRIIKMRHDDVVVAMTSGGVDNMEKYQYMLGQIRTYQYLLQEISTLLKTKEQNDKDGTIISIKPKNSSTK